MTAVMHETSVVQTTAQERRLRIVMADDDRNDQLLMVMAAEESGRSLEFSFVDDGTDLLLLLADLQTVDDLPDAIVLDLRMPRLDGHRTLDRLQAHSVFWQIPVVIFTTSHRQADQSLSLDLGARDFATKPSDFSGMISFVHRLAKVATDRLPFEDPDGALGAARRRGTLLGPDLVGDLEELFLEDIDLFTNEN